MGSKSQPPEPTGWQNTFLGERVKDNRAAKAQQDAASASAAKKEREDAKAKTLLGG